MAQLSLFPTLAPQMAAVKQNLETFPLRSSITANVRFFEEDLNDVTNRHFDEDLADFGDIYDEYLDFEVCCKKW